MAIINGYTLIEPPYKGGMAVVYKGQKGAFSRAFKMVRPDKAANNPRLCQRFLKEIQVQTKLEHPNIIKVLDAYPHTDASGVTVTVLEMEWLNGMDLQRYVEKHGKLDASTVKKIAAQVVDGLEYAHKHQILHLDIKPSNLFRTTDGYIKIIDFGIARVVGENAEIVEGASKMTIVTETGESTFKGTIAYASPEQQVGGKLAYTSDIYSFGRTLHFLATGSTHPMAEIADEHINQIVQKCTIYKPTDRYQSFAEVRQALQAPGSTSVKCSQCGSMVSGTSKFCPNCGTPIPKPWPTPAEKCPQCGHLRNGKDKFCNNCGHQFDSAPGPVPPGPTPILTGYKCSQCNKMTKAYTDGKVNYCNHCGAYKTNLTPVYK